MPMRGTLKITLLAALAALVALPATAGAAPRSTYRVVANRFHNPRALSISPDGRYLYIAAAGKSGNRCVGAPGRSQVCVGTTGSITRFDIASHARQQLAKGLPSFGNRDGTFATGADGVSLAPDGSLFGVETNAPSFAKQLLPSSSRKLVGRVLRLSGGKATPTGKVAAFETKNDPDRLGLASGPYAIAAAGAATQYVADSAGNDVLQIGGSKVSLLDALPILGSARATPTAIAIGPDGLVYVGESVGGVDGAGQVVQILPGGLERVYAAGFTRISGLAFGPAGVLYVTELTTSTLDPGSHGDVVELTPLGLGRCVVPFSDQLSFPAGAAVSPDGQTLYVANDSVLPGTAPPGGPFAGANGQIVSVPAAPLCKP
jgi:DNA-binding beta-propeller fold protein YncE